MLHIYNGEKSPVHALSLMHSALPVSESAEAGDVEAVPHVVSLICWDNMHVVQVKPFNLPLQAQ